MQKGIKICVDSYLWGHEPTSERNPTSLLSSDRVRVKAHLRFKVRSVDREKGSPTV